MAFLLSTSLFIGAALAQFPPQTNRNLTIITSPIDGNITISYKSPPLGTCRSAYDWQKQYTGWVNMPGDYPTNTFFWFVEAREPSDQLTIWLNGGPGSSSMIGMFTEVGPCEVIASAEGVFKTTYREWGWDRASHMLYIDQPNQVGFSYDTPTNGSIDLLTSKISIPAEKLNDSQPAATFLNGTFSSQNPDFTANTTEISAMAIWHMLQGFLGSFPEYSPGLNLTSTEISSMKINLFAESYGGKYAPAFASLWNEQNQKLKNGTLLTKGALEIKLATVGIVNGCVDDIIQGPYYPQMANNNSYGLKSISPTRAKMANDSFYASGGCQDLVKECRESKTLYDDDGIADHEETNALCSKAYAICASTVMGPYGDSGRSFYDIAQKLPDTVVSSAYLEYLNTASVLEAIGSPVNYTDASAAVSSEFLETGDFERQALIPELAALLADGIRVAFIYGDRDYICNWLGGEAVSLGLAAEAPAGLAASDYAVHFPEAGYAPIVTNDSYIGGVVRQFANLSFSRIYDAGHLMPAYQPETAFQVFARIIKGNSLSTGDAVDDGFATTGSAYADKKLKLPVPQTNTCWVRNVLGSCTDEETDMLAKGEGVIRGGVWYKEEADYESESSKAAVGTKTVKNMGTATVVATVTEVLTGMFTATAIPTGGAPRMTIPAVAAVAAGCAVAWNCL